MNHVRMLATLLLAMVAAAAPNFGDALFAKEYLYVHNTYSGDISKVSIPEHEVVGSIEIGYYTDYLNKSPDNKTLYVNRIYGDLPGARARNVGVDGELIAIDPSTDKIRWRLDLDGMPHHMSVSKDGRHVYVPYYDTWWLAVIDVETRQVIKKIWIGHGGHGTKVSADGKRLYVGSMMNDTLTVIDTDRLEVVDVFHFRDGVRPFVFPKDESVIYVQQSWLHGFIVVDPKTRSQRTIRLPDLGREVPVPDSYPHNVNHGLALNPTETELWAVGSVLDFVAVYKHPSLEHVTNIPIGKDGNAITFNGDGKYVYVTNRKEDNLSVIEAKTYREIKRIKLGKQPQRMIIVDVPEP